MNTTSKENLKKDHITLVEILQIKINYRIKIVYLNQFQIYQFILSQPKINHSKKKKKDDEITSKFDNSYFCVFVSVSVFMLTMIKFVKKTVLIWKYRWIFRTRKLIIEWFMKSIQVVHIQISNIIVQKSQYIEKSFCSFDMKIKWNDFIYIQININKSIINWLIILWFFIISFDKRLNCIEEKTMKFLTKFVNYLKRIQMTSSFSLFNLHFSKCLFRFI